MRKQQSLPTGSGAVYDIHKMKKQLSLPVSNSEIAAQQAKFQSRKKGDADFITAYELLPEPNPDVELVFFHGLQVDDSIRQYAFWRTWKMKNSEDCWPETLLPEMLTDRSKPPIKARVLSISYEGRMKLMENEDDGDRVDDDVLIAQDLINRLILDSDLKVGQTKGVPVFLVGHDLGGILIKRFVMTLEAQMIGTIVEEEKRKIRSFLENLKSVFFYATPHSGSPAIEKMASQIDEEEANDMLQLMKVLSTETSRINAKFQQYRRGDTHSKVSRFTSHALHAAYETNEGGFSHSVVVPEGSARCDVDSFYSVSANHFGVCQAEGTFSTTVRLLSDRIKQEVWTAKGVRAW
ncbi:hypothetical protein R1sor_015363 [Riccia sorocarpa]|uniref:DUF676 domain-containing protein n=1 Tax=Riccia sorocarpa TaxID=122646 RepID=A0ABD3HF14_9MARC